MGANLEQLGIISSIVKEYTDGELGDAERRIGALLQALYEVIKNERDDPLHVLSENVGLEDTPIGNIITFMGTKCPKHYLPCDGTIYNIADYPMLAQHMIDQFEQVNFFGGDGETTFAVPDLRGEFLRGTGTNSHVESGNGAAVGVHQTATMHSYVHTGAAGNCVDFPREGNVVQGADFAKGTKTWSSTPTYNGTWTGDCSRYASRPTNTSVLYCIKYEPTFYLRAGSDTDYYSEEETCIGTWIDGKPLYRKTIVTPGSAIPNDNKGGQVKVPSGIENIDSVVNIHMAIDGTDADGKWTVINDYISGSADYYISKFYHYTDNVFVIKLSSMYRNGTILRVRTTIEYTKTT